MHISRINNYIIQHIIINNYYLNVNDYIIVYSLLKMRKEQNNKNTKITHYKHPFLFEYLWLDVNQHMRSKIRTFIIECDYRIDLSEILSSKTSKERFISLIPEWSYDGSSTGQCETAYSEVILKPVNFIKHPFMKPSIKGGQPILVLCEGYRENKPIIGNDRYDYITKMNHVKSHDIWFGLEQEFFLFDKTTKQPINWNEVKHIDQGEYYCGVNRSTYKEKQILNVFLEKCLHVGIQISGINQEVAPCQWEYQIGPVCADEAPDQMIFAKYILYNIAQEYDAYTNFHPKPLKGNWNGSGCHINISTTQTRGKNGFQYMQQIITKMSEDHVNFIKEYCGSDNEQRLTGFHETSNPTKFSYSVGGRDCSVRIPQQVEKERCGYFEDRRPGSSINYYKTLGKYADYIQT
jgi:glutamine synthetase